MKNNQLIKPHSSPIQSHGETSGLAMPAESSESEVIEILETIPSVERRRVSDVRKSFNNRYKAHAILHAESGKKAINKATIIRIILLFIQKEVIQSHM